MEIARKGYVRLKDIYKRKMVWDNDVRAVLELILYLHVCPNTYKQ
ncbi:MAG: hypothetical protein ACI9UR_002709 [Bacteroidia bacterium]|jgi:hypothetical protein